MRKINIVVPALTEERGMERTIMSIKMQVYSLRRFRHHMEL
jgi:hypothetical protein